MSKRTVEFIPLVLSLVCATALRTNAQSEDNQALRETQKVLTDKNERAKVLDADAQAKQTDANLRAFAGSDQNAEAVYGLSADVFNDIAEKTGGDPAKMQELLDQAKRDPAAFARSLSPQQQARIKALANDIENSQKKMP